jgi:hypothetical protein
MIMPQEELFTCVFNSVIRDERERRCCILGYNKKMIVSSQDLKMHEERLSENKCWQARNEREVNSFKMKKDPSSHFYWASLFLKNHDSSSVIIFEVLKETVFNLSSCWAHG